SFFAPFRPTKHEPLTVRGETHERTMWHVRGRRVKLHRNPFRIATECRYLVEHRVLKVFGFKSVVDVVAVRRKAETLIGDRGGRDLLDVALRGDLLYPQTLLPCFVYHVHDEPAVWRDRRAHYLAARG